MNTFGPQSMAATDEGCGGLADEHSGQLLELPMGLCHLQIPPGVPLFSLVKGR